MDSGRNRLFAATLVIAVAIATVALTETAGYAGDQVDPGDLTSLYDPSQSPPLQASPLAAAAQAADCNDEAVALIESNVSWLAVPGSTKGANAYELDEQNIDYCVLSPGDLGTMDLGQFDRMIISSAQSQSFYDALFPGGSVHSALAEWVADGGVLIGNMTDRASGPGSGGSWTGDSFIGGVSYVADNSDDSDIATNHPILEGTQCEFGSTGLVIGNCGPVVDNEDGVRNDLDGWGWSHHGYFANLPADTAVILDSPDHGPVLIEYEYGEGLVVASMLTAEWRYAGGFAGFDPKRELTSNLVAYRGENDPIYNGASCQAQELSAGQQSVGPIDLGYSFEFDGIEYDQAWVNANGTVTLDGPFTSGPTGSRVTSLDRPILAPFWSDVDVNGSGTITYGVANLKDDAGRVLCVTWTDVTAIDGGDAANTFQLVLRGGELRDVHFDFVYERIEWDSVGGDPSAQAGWRLGETHRLVAGSGVTGVLTDDGVAPLTDRGTSPFTDGRFHARSDHRFGVVQRFDDRDFTEDGLGLIATDRNRIIGDLVSSSFRLGFSELVDAQVIAGPNAGQQLEVADTDPGAVVFYRGLGGPGVDIVKVDYSFRYTRHAYVAVEWHEGPVQASLGDSYSSGEGIHGASDGGYVAGYDGFKECHRSRESWPASITVAGNWRGGPEPVYSDPNSYFAFLACTGAKTVNVVADTQIWRNLDTLPLYQVNSSELSQAQGPNPGLDGERQGELLQEVEIDVGVDLATITIGGNDALWIDTIKACFLYTNCFNATKYYVPGGWTYLDDALWRLDIVEDRVEATIRDIKTTSPDATVLLSGYPQVFPAPDPILGTVCPKLDPSDPIGLLDPIGIEPDEIEIFRALQVAFDDSLREVAERNGIHFVSVIDTFAGHEICGRRGEWINWVSIDFGDAAIDPATGHPTAEGHAAWAETIDEYFDDLIAAGAPTSRFGIPLNPDTVEAAEGLLAAPMAIGESSPPPPISVLEMALQAVDASTCGVPHPTVVTPGGRLRLIARGLGSLSAATIEFEQADVAGVVVVGSDVVVADELGVIDIEITVPSNVDVGSRLIVNVIGQTDAGAVTFGADVAQVGATTSPCLDDDIVAVGLNGTATVAVLDNDDPAGSPFVLETLSVDPDYTGTASIDAGGIVTVSPPPNWIGSSALTYTVCRSDGVCADGRIVVEIEPGCTVFGTRGDDVLVATAGADVICGFGGDDIIIGAGPGDVILAGAGDDILLGTEGVVLAVGGTGNDLFSTSIADVSDITPDEERDPNDIIEDIPDDGHDNTGDSVPPVVEIEFIDGEHVCTAIDDQDGSVACEISGPTLSDDGFVVTAEAIDSSGNVATASRTFSSATWLAELGGWSLVAADGVTLTGSSLDGRVLAGGSVVLDQWSIGADLDIDPARVDLAVGDDLDADGGSVPNGSVTYGGQLLAGVSAPNGTVIQAPLDIDLPATMASISESITGWETIAPTGEISNSNPDWTTLRLESDQSLNVFEIDAASLQDAHAVEIRTPAGSTTIIRVTGESFDTSSGAVLNSMLFWNGKAYKRPPKNPHGPDARDTLVWVFPDATNVGIGPDLAWAGSIIAPAAEVTIAESVPVHGAIVSGSITGEMTQAAVVLDTLAVP